MEGKIVIAVMPKYTMLLHFILKEESRLSFRDRLHSGLEEICLPADLHTVCVFVYK